METGAYFQLVPHGDRHPAYLWRHNVDPRDPKQAANRIGRRPPVVCSRDFNLFVIGLPRRGDGPPGIVHHLLDRDRHLWRLAAADNGKYDSPYKVVGFANGDDSIVAYDDNRLFTIPVASIQTAENVVR